MSDDEINTPLDAIETVLGYLTLVFTMVVLLLFFSDIIDAIGLDNDNEFIFLVYGAISLAGGCIASVVFHKLFDIIFGDTKKRLRKRALRKGLIMLMENRFDRLKTKTGKTLIRKTL